MDISCAAIPCPVILNSTCVFYEGNTLVYTGINSGDNLQTALQKIDAKFEDAGLGYVFVNGLIQTAPGVPVGLGGSLINDTAIGGNYRLTFAGSLESQAFVTTGGTSSQFVKGDGSLDNGSYQPAGNYISALTGDGTANGPGSAVFTLATVNATIGTFGTSTMVPRITVNNKGLVTNVVNTLITVPSGVLIFTGDVTGSGMTGSPVTLTLLPVNADVYGPNTFLKFAVNAKGLVTSATLVTAFDIIGALGYTPVPSTRTITINGVTRDLSANRTFSVGTVTNVSVSSGVGISASVTDPTNAPIINITNTAPDRIVVLNSGANINVTGSYPNFTINGTASGGTVTSVGLSMPAAFSVSNSPITTNGTIAVIGAGTISEYVRGDGSLATFPSLAGYLTNVTASAPISSSGGTTPNISIPAATTSVSGYLTSTDWNTFDGKQSQLNGTGFVKASGTTITYDNSTYLTNISGIAAGGELSGTYPNPTLVNSAVIGKVLTGLNVVGGSIAATDDIVGAFGKVQNQINGLVGGLIYQGTWNASTNTPNLTSGVGTNGYFYIVSVAGTTNLDGNNNWHVGDWAVFHTPSWEIVDNTDAVTSVNGFIGAVVLSTTDIAEGTNLYYTDTRARNAISGGTGISYAPSTGIITNSAPDQTVSLSNGTAISVTGTYPSFTIANTAPDQTVSLSNGTGISVSGTYPNFTITNTAPSSGGTVTGTGTTNTLPKFTSASSIGDSNVKDNGNVVTVNATAGSFGALQVGNYNGSILMNTTSTSGGLIFQNTSSGNKLWDFSSYNNDINFNESLVGYPVMTLQAGGNVGIKQVNPAYRLDIDGTFRTTGVATFGSTLSNGTYSYTLPGATGTLALTSDIPSISGYVPYTGATTNLNLGSFNLTATDVTANGTLTLLGNIAASKTVSSGSPYSFVVTQNSTNATDTGDGALYVNHILSGVGSGTELVTRSFIFSSDNQRTGGSVLSNSRVLYLVSSTQAGTTTTNLDQVYIEGGAMVGSVTNNRGVLVKTMQGTNQAAFVATGLTSSNRVHLLLGNYTLPTGAWGIYSGLTDPSYLQGSLLLGSATDDGVNKLQVTGATKVTGQLTLGSTITNGTYTYTLPSATGTLALTSDLSGYLPLTGGALTGSLSITSAAPTALSVVGIASVSGNLILTGTYTDYRQQSYIRFSNTGGGTRWGYIQHDGTNMAFVNDISGGGFTFNKAATLESTLRINSAGQSLLIFPTTTSSVRMQIQSSGGGNMIVGCDNSSGGDLATGTTTYSTVIGSGSTRDLFLVTNSIQRFKIDGTSGAATFSGPTVTIGSAAAATNVKLLFNGVASKAAGIEFQQSGSPQWYLGNGIASEDNNFELYNSNGTMAMKIIKSTNTINFTGSNEVMNIAGTNASSAYTGYYYNTSTLVGYIGNGSSILSGAASSDFIFRSQGDLVVATGGNNRRLTIASTGAATFSSSVTATNSSTGFAINATSAYTGSTSNNPIITFGRAGSAVAGAIGYDDNLGSLYTGTTTGHNFLIKTNSATVATFTSGGNVGIGTASPVSLLTVATGNVTNAGQWSSSAIALYNPTNVGAYSQISFGYTSSTTNASAYIGYVSTNQASNGFGDLVFGTRAVSTDTQPTERMRITSAGNVTVSNLLIPTRLSLSSYTSLYGKAAVKGDNVSSLAFNLSTLFPEMSSTFTSNVVGCFGIYTIFRGGAAETGIFSICRNGGGTWSSAAYSVQTATSTPSISTITGSGTTITMSFNTSVYVLVEVTAMIE